ncbi:MAG: SDR family NAD(P)-dependent oxidoreductase [Actinomycetota bacterium]|nr:SDR family NAD(P)-dependent oxidoreductase [Actinomycetota bacterium]
MAPELEGRRALITGASGGLGQAIARALHARGATLLLTARRAELLEQLRGELGERVETLTADLADRQAVRELPERAGHVDVLVANAGLPASGPLLTFEPDQIDRALDVNLRAPMQLARALAPAMVERGHGHLVFMSSIAGKVANPGSSLYSATKFGLRGFAFALSEDLRGTGVGVTTVFPGFISEAGMFHDTGVRLPRGTGTRSPEQVAAAVLKGIESGRAEIDVAPLPQRAGGWIAGIAPSALAAVVRRLGGQEVSSQMAKAQEGKR